MRANLPASVRRSTCRAKRSKNSRGFPCRSRTSWHPRSTGRRGGDGYRAHRRRGPGRRRRGAARPRDLPPARRRGQLAGRPARRRPAPLRTGGLKSSFERADWFDIGPLSPPATLTALAEPAVRAGRPYEAGAAEHLAAHTGGYPYAVQLYGHAAWRRSQGQPVISAGAVDLAVRLPVLSSSATFTASAGSARLQRTPVLVALAETIAAGGDPTGAAVAERLGVTAKDLSMIRERLIDKGTLVAAGRASASWCRDWPPLCSARSASQPRSATSSPCRSGPVITPTVPLRPARARFSTRRPGQVPRDFDGDLDR